MGMGLEWLWLAARASRAKLYADTPCVRQMHRFSPRECNERRARTRWGAKGGV